MTFKMIPIACFVFLSCQTREKDKTDYTSSDSIMTVSSDSSNVVDYCRKSSSSKIMDTVEYFLSRQGYGEEICNCLRAGIENDNKDIYAYFGELLLSERICNEDTITGMKYLIKSVELGSILGFFKLGQYYIRNNEIEKGLGLLNKASISKNIDAQYFYATILLYGDLRAYGKLSTKISNCQNIALGNSYMRESADKGNPYAQLEMARLLSDKNKEDGFKYLVQAQKSFEINGEESYILDVEELLKNDYKGR